MKRRVKCGAGGRRASVCGKRGARTGKEAEIRGREAPRVRRAEDARFCVSPAQACKDRSPAPASSGAARLLPPSPASRGQTNGRNGGWGERGAGRGGARGLRAGAARRPARLFRCHCRRRCRRRAFRSAEGSGLRSLLLPPRLRLPVGPVSRCRWEPVSSPALSTVRSSGSLRVRPPPRL